MRWSGMSPKEAIRSSTTSSRRTPAERDVAFLPDSKTILVAGKDGTSVVDIATGRQVRRIEGAFAPIAVSPDGRTLAATLDPTTAVTIGLFDLASGHRARHARRSQRTHRSPRVQPRRDDAGVGWRRPPRHGVGRRLRPAPGGVQQPRRLGGGAGLQPRQCQALLLIARPRRLRVGSPPRRHPRPGGPEGRRAAARVRRGLHDPQPRWAGRSSSARSTTSASSSGT